MQLTGDQIIGYHTSAKGEKTFHGITANKDAGNTTFRIATTSEVKEAMEKAHRAFDSYRQLSGAQRAAFLYAIAEAIEALGDILVQTVVRESGLPEGRVRGERGRTTGQLRLFADFIREGSWVDAVIDHEDPDRTPVPKPGIRRMLVPLGPVVVFTASNFPLAFSTAGGDTASALAAGCPVVVKGHEAHPATNELVSRAIQKAAQETGMPDGVFSSLNGDYETGQALVTHPLTAAVAFTGSLRGGKALFDLANKRPVPIPVFAEMGSVNPIIVLPHAMKEKGETIAGQIAGSVGLGAGQFCTNPGLIFLPRQHHETFTTSLTRQMEKASGQCMLNQRIFENYRQKLHQISQQAGVQLLYAPEESRTDHVLPSAGIAGTSDFLRNTHLQEEVFGPFTLLITYQNRNELKQLVTTLHGQLTATLFCENDEIKQYRDVVSELQSVAGRLILNGVPTGVEVCHAMHHGGPYPATTDARFTSVGTDATRRFVRPVAFQDFPEEMLPEALQEHNPLGIWRKVDGEMKK